MGLADITVLVLAPGLKDDIQATKAGLIEMADILVVNKADYPGADALIMEIESIIHGRDNKVCRTIATETTGIEELIAIIHDINQKKRQNGQFIQHRLKSRELEVWD